MTKELADMTMQRDHWLEIAREKDAEIERLLSALRRLHAKIGAQRDLQRLELIAEIEAAL